MDIILLIVVLSIVSSLARRIKKPAERKTQNQMQSVSSGQGLSMRTKPLVPGSKTEPDLMTGALGSFLQRLGGEDQTIQTQRLARSTEDRLYKENELKEQQRMESESEEKSNAEARKWEMEMKDSNEISDLPELQDLITDEQVDIEDSRVGVAIQWNLAEAQKGIIWNEILEGPRFKTDGTRRHRI